MRGSFVNKLMSSSKIQEVKVGDGATLLLYSDRNPCTVTKVDEKKNYTLVEVQEDSYKRTDSNGMSDSQEYTYSQNPNGRTYLFQIKNNVAQEVVLNPETKRLNKANSAKIYFGKREKYHDFTF